MNERLSSSEQDSQKRSILIAAVLGFLSPGLGLLYVGKGRWALLVPCILLASIAIFSWSRFLLISIGYWLAISSLVLFIVFVIYISCKFARLASRDPEYWYQRWYMYILFFCAMQIINVMILQNYRH